MRNSERQAIHPARDLRSGGGGRHVVVAASAAALAVSMLGAAYAAVPLYQLFCQVTGFAGTMQRAERAPDTVLEKTVIIRFDANIAGGLAWSFAPVQAKLPVRIGESTLAFYTATNPHDVPLTGTATFNVAPAAAGRYFNKMECFCFTEQTLAPGETVEMPVSFFVDPEFAVDRDSRNISQITLSYTFYPVKEKAALEDGRQGKKGT